MESGGFFGESRPGFVWRGVVLFRLPEAARKGRQLTDQFHDDAGSQLGLLCGNRSVLNLQRRSKKRKPGSFQFPVEWNREFRYRADRAALALKSDFLLDKAVNSVDPGIQSFVPPGLGRKKYSFNKVCQYYESPLFSPSLGEEARARAHCNHGFDWRLPEHTGRHPPLDTIPRSPATTANFEK